MNTRTHASIDLPNSVTVPFYLKSRVLALITSDEYHITLLAGNEYLAYRTVAISSRKVRALYNRAIDITPNRYSFRKRTKKSSKSSDSEAVASTSSHFQVEAIIHNASQSDSESQASDASQALQTILKETDSASSPDKVRRSPRDNPS